jgi:mono/diheme cytochrome c family protein
MRKRDSWIGIGLGAVAGLAGLVAGAEEPRETPGQVLFQKYCAACHGALADGRGPVAPYLNPRPPDLTKLAERYGAPMPRELLAEYVDGRRDVRAHGTREMPVWGEQLFPDVPAGAEVEAAKAATLWLIIDYLESIQGKSISQAFPYPDR